MASTFKQEDVIIVPAKAAPPYSPEYLTGIEGEYFCKGQEFDQFKKKIGSVHIGTVVLARIPFDFELERTKETDEMGRDIVLNIHCNNASPDPHWRCSFSAIVECPQSALESDISIFEDSMTATRTVNTLTFPLLKSDTCDTFKTLQVKANIKVTSWHGFFPEHVQSFTDKTNISDATLIVEGRPLYVSRAILAIQSTFFHTLFYNRGFKDAAKSEFVLQDVGFNEMNMFLSLVYPNNSSEKYKCITHINQIDDMLALGERFGCDSITRLMEKFLMGEMPCEIRGWTYGRRMKLSDRFHLSAPLSFLMSIMRNDEELQRLGDSEEYSSLSKDIKAALLDMRMRRPIEAEPDFSKRPELIEKLQDESRMQSYYQTVNATEARRKRTDAQNAIAAAVRRANAVLRPTVPSDDQLWTDFETDVAQLPAAAANIALTSAQSDELDRAVRFLQEMSKQEYDAVQHYHRITLNAYIRTVIEAGNDTEEARATGRAHVLTLLSLVQLLRSGGPPPRKRMRVRNYVLRQ